MLKGSEAVRVSRPLLFSGGVLLLVLGFFAGTRQLEIQSFFSQYFGQKVASDTIDLASVQQTYRYLKANYDGNLDTAALIAGANRGLVAAAGDKYTVYLDAKEAKEFNDDLSGNVGAGIGAVIQNRDGKPTIGKLLEDNPAIDAGLLVGDIIIKVNDESAADWDSDKAASKIRGEAGTSVKLEVLRDKQTKSFTITRAVINNPSVEHTIKDGVGIMTISRFDSQTGGLALKAAEVFKQKNVKGVVVDLRSDGGGYMDAAVDVAGLWLNDKVVVTQRVGGAITNTLRSGSTAPLKGIKTAVLINGGSASASEILASALKDNAAATLVGEKSFGKGSVQQVLNLDDNALLKVTVSKWYSSGGYNVNDKGLTPELKVAFDEKAFNKGIDTQLDAAKTFVTK